MYLILSAVPPVFTCTCSTSNYLTVRKGAKRTWPNEKANAVPNSQKTKCQAKKAKRGVTEQESRAAVASDNGCKARLPLGLLLMVGVLGSGGTGGGRVGPLGLGPG